VSLITPIDVKILVNPLVTAEERKAMEAGLAALRPQYLTLRESGSAALIEQYALDVALEFEDASEETTYQSHLAAHAFCRMLGTPQHLKDRDKILGAVRAFVIKFLYEDCKICPIGIGFTLELEV
jgi:hypothetical protein